MEIEFRNISKSFGGVHALQKASLSIKNGEIRALLGGNGSGKSTLIKIASGLVVQDGGNIYIDGSKINIKSPKSAKKIGLVATSQELSILLNLTVGENITLCSIPQHLRIFTDYKNIRRKTLDILKRLGLEEKIDTPTYKLPLNEQYLIELGKAIFQDFDLLMIDEVTSALYSRDVSVVKRILHEYKSQGKIILFVSHRLHELHTICDSVTVMKNGETIKTCDIKEVNDEDLLALMIGSKTENNQKDKVSLHEHLDKKPFIIVENLPIKRYKTSISLEIMRGEIIGIAGLQGHGQSDIVRTLHGMNGNIELIKDNKKTIVKNPRSAVRHRFAFISGDREREGSFRQHNLTDNISTVMELMLKNKPCKPESVLQEMNIKYDTPGQNIMELSGGNQQKVLVGRWTYTGPELLLADDPSKGIDVQARNELKTILHKLSNEGTAMLIVSSDEDELVSLCAKRSNARVIVLYEGKIVTTLRGEDITRDNIIMATLGKGDR